MVIVPALVKDADGHVVYGLEAKDFIIEDDGVEQQVELDEAAESEPVSLVIAVQCGRRASYELPRMRGLSSMLDPILEQQDTQAAVVTFDSGVQLLQDFTNNEATIDRTLKSLAPGDGGAAILDAVKYSASLLDNLPPGGRHVLLLISETRDHGSRSATINEVASLIGNSNTAVYALAFSPSLSNILNTERGSNQAEMNAGPDLLAPLVLAREAMRKKFPQGNCSYDWRRI